MQPDINGITRAIATRLSGLLVLAGTATLGLALVLWACHPTPPSFDAQSRNGNLGLSGRWIRADTEMGLAELAARHRANVDDIEELNGLDRRDAVREGQDVFIPLAVPLVQASEQPSSSSKAQTKPLPRALPIRLAWPVPGGVLLSRFRRGTSPVHEGIDIAAPFGKPVVAAADGTVIYTGSQIEGYGNLILLRHQGNFVTVYARNRHILVQEGQRVSRGEIIGEVGANIKGSRPYLHFETRQAELAQDPLSFF